MAGKLTREQYTCLLSGLKMLEVPEVPAPPLPLENGEVGTVQEEAEEPGLGKAQAPLLGKAKNAGLAKRDSESVSVDSLGLPNMFNSKKVKADGPKPMSTQRPGNRLTEAMGYAQPKAKAKPKAKAVMKRPGMPGVKKKAFHAESWKRHCPAFHAESWRRHCPGR